MPAPKAQFLPLTGIRFLLALWVIVFHATLGFRGVSRLPTILFCLVRTGSLAVGVFFVLSGFVLSYNYSLNHSWSSPERGRFAAARFARIYPTYCLGLLLIAPFVASGVIRDLSPVNLSREAGVALLNWTLLQSWVPRIALSWNGPGWSLSDEAFFYCCFPFIGVALWKLSRVRSLVTAGALLWAAALVVPILAVMIPMRGFGDAPATSLLPNVDPAWPNLVKFNPLLRLPEFCVGIILAKAYLLLSDRKSALLGRGYYLYIPGLILELLAVAKCDSIPYPLVHNGLFLPLHAMIILGFALGGGITARVLSVRPLLFLGQASYTMYILHTPLLWWMDRIATRSLSLQFRSVGGLCVSVLVIIVLSSLVFRFFDEPAHRILKKRLVRRKEIPYPATSR